MSAFDDVLGSLDVVPDEIHKFSPPGWTGRSMFPLDAPVIGQRAV